MKLYRHLLSLVSVLVAGAWVGCGGNVPLGSMNEGGSPQGAGGTMSTGGLGGSNVDAAVGGSILGTGGVVGSGGNGTGTGGIDAPIATGGMAGAGGAQGTGGGTGTTCGTIAGLTCATGMFCDLMGCGMPDASGVCRPIGGACTTEYAPVCGCNGKTYANDCIRIQAGVLKASAGTCGVGTGGAPGSGGGTGVGGRGGGGAGGSGGSTRPTCGGLAGLPCPSGQTCDIDSRCGKIFDATGTCVTTGGGCTAVWVPVCGCDGKTYANDCTRVSKGVSKASDGACPTAGVDAGAATFPCAYQCRTDSSGVTGWYSGDTLICAAKCTGCVPSCSNVGTDSEGCWASCAGGSMGAGCGDSSATNLIKYQTCGQSYPNAYLQWEAPGGVAGTGPVVVVSAAGWADTWDNVAGFSPEAPLPSNATGTYALTRAQTDDLFSRLASVSFASLPHPGYQGFECYPRLYFRLCEGCTATTLNYHVPQELAPDLENVWSWFDQLLGKTAFANPRNYCSMIP